MTWTIIKKEFLSRISQQAFGDKLKAKYITWRIAHWGTFDNDEIPVFEEKRMTISEGLHSAFLDLLILFLSMLLFFVAAFVAFLRYDVR